MRLRDRAEVLLELLRLARRDGLAAARPRHGLAFGVADGGDQLAGARGGVIVAHPGPDLDGGAILADLGGGDEGAAFVLGRSLERDVQAVANDQPDIAIDAAV